MKLLHAKERLQKLCDQQVALHEELVIRSSSTNPKVYWSYINSKLKRNKNRLNSIKVGNRVVEDPTEIAESFNQYFYDNFNHNPLKVTVNSETDDGLVT